MAPILPGSTIGILGGGQLGRMTALAARSLGYRVAALDPAGDCPARPVVDRLIEAPFDDAEAAGELAKISDVVTLEIEKIGPAALRAVAAHAPLRPRAEIVETIQNRGKQKDWLVGNGFPLGPFRHVNSAEEAKAAAEEFGGAGFLKVCVGGYDGRGQIEISTAGEAPAAWTEFGAPCVLEKRLDLAEELSVMVARRPSGQSVVFPPALNHHERRILAWSATPAPLDENVLRQARKIATGIADAIGLEGVLAVELFWTKSGVLYVNELAPRPHNSFHATELACPTSQFEQLVRAVCDLPLGAVEPVRPTAIVNLLGELWAGGDPDFAAALEVPGVRLHLYGKTQARAGRKMGHLSAIAGSVEEARDRVIEAGRRLARG